jgi:Sulfatase
LSRVQGADVFLVFLESYGAASFERPELAAGLAASRRQFDAAIHSTNRDVVSAYVESPTFGGSSWLAHISLMSGIEVRQPDTNALLMTQKRETLVTTFGRHGYRTVALMPGLWQSWPEGAFYGFDEIYGTARLNYHGPGFGWFYIPDQFAIAQLDAIEKSRLSRAPLFVFFPTISTHTPFRPTPPYQSDWQRVLTDEPYETTDLDRAFEREPDWMDLGPSYVDAISYSYTTLGGYLTRADRDFVMIVVGDHQPPALVSGEGASWDVPAHVITSRRAVLEQLRIHGFQTGLTPHRPAVGRMHELLTVLLDAFGDRELPAVIAAGS